MKIIEKKCPNCGANLKFKAGDHEARCESCRREYIIENDTKDIFDLVPAAKLFGKFFAVQSIIISVIAIVIFGVVTFGIIYGIVSFNAKRENSFKDYESNADSLYEMLRDAPQRPQ